MVQPSENGSVPKILNMPQYDILTWYELIISFIRKGFTMSLNLDFLQSKIYAKVIHNWKAC